MEFQPVSFRCHAPDADLEDLKKRLDRVRAVPETSRAVEYDPSGSWTGGTDRDELARYLRHWADGFDWRQQEAKLNELPHFLVGHRGLQTHFIHLKSNAARAVPLLLVHGWPGSVAEFQKAIPLLADAGFHVVAPSLPGFAWSEASAERGMDVHWVADHLHELMQGLGYTHYVAQGGDWGGMISSRIAFRYPEHCVALHLNFCIALPTDWYAVLKSVIGMLFMSRDEWDALKSTIYFIRWETAYQAIQGTKPQSLAYGLNDSPVGLLAWQLEKFQSWGDCGSNSPDASGLSMDEILTNATIYWMTQSIGSSFRLYYESLGLNPAAAKVSYAPGGFVPVPTGVLWAKRELIKLPRHVVASCFNLKRWTKAKKGGHFFAFEQPHAFVEDVKKFFKETTDFDECCAKAPKHGSGRGFEPIRYLLVVGVAAATVLTVSRWCRKYA